MIYTYTHKNLLIFESDSVVLEVCYDDDTYEDEKNKLNNQFVFFKGSSMSEAISENEEHNSDYDQQMVDFIHKYFEYDF